MLAGTILARMSLKWSILLKDKQVSWSTAGFYTANYCSESAGHPAASMLCSGEPGMRSPRFHELGEWGKKSVYKGLVFSLGDVKSL